MARGVLAAMLLLCASGAVRAQQQVPPDSSHAVVTVVARDSLLSAQTLADTSRQVFRPRKSTTTAMLLSALLPGAGQAYNESYWKVPIVLGFGIYFISSWLDNNRRYHDYRDKYAQSIKDSPPNGSSIFLQVREFWKDQRDGFAWYFAIMYALNIVDAYVDASLYDFTVGDDLSIRRMPAGGAVLEQAPHFRLHVHIPLP